MKRQFLIALAVVLCFSVQGFGQKKKDKLKEKRYEPVVRETIEDYAGVYLGFDDEHSIEVRAQASGLLLVTVKEGKRVAVLRNMRLSNATLTGSKRYADGHEEKFSGVFANRILNGETTFGLLVEGPFRIDESLTVERVFYRLR